MSFIKGEESKFYIDLKQMEDLFEGDGEIMALFVEELIKENLLGDAKRIYI